MPIVFSLCYGLNNMDISDSDVCEDVCELDSIWGRLMKQSLGPSKRSQSTQLLQALGIKPVSEIN